MSDEIPATALSWRPYVNPIAAQLQLIVGEYTYKKPVMEATGLSRHAVGTLVFNPERISPEKLAKVSGGLCRRYPGETKAAQINHFVSLMVAARSLPVKRIKMRLAEEFRHDAAAATKTIRRAFGDSVDDLQAALIGLGGILPQNLRASFRLMPELTARIEAVDPNIRPLIVSQFLDSVIVAYKRRDSSRACSYVPALAAAKPKLRGPI